MVVGHSHAREAGGGEGGQASFGDREANSPPYTFRGITDCTFEIADRRGNPLLAPFDPR